MRVTARHPSRSANSQALSQEFYDLNRLVMVNPQPVNGLRIREVFSTARANIPLRDAISIFEVTHLFARARAAMTVFQLAFPGNVNYR
jgi:hypothetical protein